jgi:hypothetical protein
MRTVLLLGLLLLFCTNPASAQGFRFYGDFLLSRGVEKFAAENGATPVRKALAPFLARDAVHVVNLEGAAGDAGHCAEGHHPCFATKPDLLDLLSGLDVVSLENNHALDLGPAGLRKTIRALKRRNIVPLGGKDFSTLIPTDDGNLGIVAVTDVVNAPGDQNSVTLTGAPEVLKEIRRLKKRTTAIAVYLHWGRELLPMATERMRELARKYVAAGADVVVGTHPHVTGSVACVEGKPVVWSLGNFLFDQKYETTKKGAVLACAIGVDDKLRCALVAHETSLNSYLPRISSGDPFRAENGVLAVCTPAVNRKWTGKFSRDKREKSLVLKREGRASSLSFLELYDLLSGKREAKSTPMPIRKVETVDLNGDGIREIMLIQEIYSSFDRETAKRVYLYSLDGGFHALWRGSALSRPLLDAAFVPGNKGKPLLVALHSADSFLARNPKCEDRLVMTYRWNGFGFTGIRELQGERDSDSVKYAKGRVRLLRKWSIVSEIPIQVIRGEDK